VEGRYHVTAWNRFYPFFINLIKSITEEAKLFNHLVCIVIQLPARMVSEVFDEKRSEYRPIQVKTNNKVRQKAGSSDIIRSKAK